MNTAMEWMRQIHQTTTGHKWTIGQPLKLVR